MFAHLKRLTLVALLFSLTVSSGAFALEVHKSNCAWWFGWMRAISGSHYFYRINGKANQLDERLPESLAAFGRSEDSRSTRIKKNWVFNPKVVNWLHNRIAYKMELMGDLDGKSIYDRIKVSTGPKDRFNYVIMGDRGAKDGRNGPGVIVGRIKLRKGFKFLDNIFSKHVLLSNYHPDVRSAGEFWKGEDGKFYFNVNSGTYRPTPEVIDSVRQILLEQLPQDGSVELVADDTLGD